MDNRFENKGKDLNIGQGDGAIGKQVNNYGISPEVFAQYRADLAVTDTALSRFFRILEEQQVPRSDLDSRLREIAATHKELLTRLETVKSHDPEVVRLKKEARQAIKAGNYAKAEELLNQAEDRDLKAIEELEQAAKQRRISAAETNADQARLQEMQLRYAKAAEYWQKVASLLPQDSKKERAYCLNPAGYDLFLIARWNEAMPLYENSLDICQEIGEQAGEGTALNNIGRIYDAQGEYTKALPM
ncbi:MAG: tetratricopeptide repeat protein [Candidatus Electrothrix sp. YB6]